MKPFEQLKLEFAPATPIDASVTPGIEEGVKSIQLKWDFHTTFPRPLPEAFVSLVEDVSDMDDEAIRSIHQEHAGHCLAILRDMDALEEARQSGNDPRTGKPPKNDEARKKLKRHIEDASNALNAELEQMLDVYARAFGDEAGEAFRTALLAWNMNVEVKPSPTTCTVPEDVKPSLNL